MTSPFGSDDHSIDALDNLSPELRTLDQRYQADGMVWRRRLPDANAAAQRVTALLAQQSKATLSGDTTRPSRLTSITLPDTSLGGTRPPNVTPQQRQRSNASRARSYLAVAAMLVVVLLLGLLLHVYAAGRAIGPTHEKTPIASATSAVTATPSTTTTPPATMPYTFPATWKNANGSLTIASPIGYAFAQTDQQIGYACDASTSALYKTSDGGNSWQSLSNTPFAACAGVFIDGQDANDVFIQLLAPAGAGTAPLWRSNNGGTTWQKLGKITGTNLPPLSWGNVAVVNGRLIAAVQIAAEGSVPDPLYYSDDGGLTWHTLAQTLINQGNTLDAIFAVAGSAIYINGTSGTGAGGLRTQWLRDHMPQINPLDKISQLSKSSGNPPAQQFYWRSTDAGNTWTPVTLPGGLPIFVRAASGASYYAISALSQQVGQDNGTPVYDTTFWWSSDSGATWTRLPDLRGLEHGYVMGSSPDSYTYTVAPDGTVFVPAFHSTQSRGDDAGVFTINPNDAASATWKPLVAGGVQYWQAVTTSTGIRLWGVGSFGNDLHLKYVDMP